MNFLIQVMNDGSIADHRVFEVSGAGLRVSSFKGNQDQMERQALVWENRTDDGDVSHANDVNAHSQQKFFRCWNT